jgi:hypothetical protein
MVDMTPKFSGEPTAQALANGLATLGRYGDNYMVHAAEGETVVPGQILDANPQLRESLFTQMKAMGIEDPNRYVVGSDLNSINPITGQPEFFFKKIFKAIKGVAKKAAPLAAAAVGNFLFPGIGGPIGAGLFTKATGGSFGDALKSAGLAYATQSLLRGAQGFQSAPAGEGIGGFFSGVQQGAMEPFQAASNLFSSGPANPISQGIFGRLSDGTAGLNMDTFFPKYDPNLGQGTGATNLLTQNTGQTGGIQKVSSNMMDANTFTTQSKPVSGTAAGAVFEWETPLGNMSDAQYKAAIKALQPQSAQNVIGNVTDFEGGVAQGIQKADEAATLGGKIKDVLTSKEFLGPALAGGIPAIATYALTPEEEELTPDQLQQLTDPQRAAYNKYRALTPEEKKSGAGQALLQQSGITSFYTPEQLARITGITPEQAETFQASKFGIATVAAGGEIIGPGSGTSDSIPAMLSDGEFVMTAEAVRNAGGGDRDLGAARMYDTMNRLERAV